MGFLQPESRQFAMKHKRNVDDTLKNAVVKKIIAQRGRKARGIKVSGYTKVKTTTIEISGLTE